MPNKHLICLTPDRNFFSAACFAAQKLLAHGLDDGVDIAIACTPPDVDRKALERFSAGRLELITDCFDDAADDMLAGLPLGRHLTKAAYRRLLLPLVLPAHYERILYLDCDTLIVRPGLERLFGLDLRGAAFAAAIDMIFLKDFENGSLTDTFRAYRAGLGLALDRPYFNSGVMLIDRARWLENAITERALAFARARPELCRFQDQSALNAVACELWAPLSPRFNFMGDFLRLGLMGVIEPIVLHFVNDPKPWQRDRWRGPSWMRMLYDRNADISVADTPVTPALRRFRERLLPYLASRRFIDDGLELMPGVPQAAPGVSEAALSVPRRAARAPQRR